MDSEKVPGKTMTEDFTLYVGPWMTVNRDGQYTKHIYAGAERVVSQVGDTDNYLGDQFSEIRAGHGTGAAAIDYLGKYRAQTARIKALYDEFEVPYNGKDNHANNPDLYGVFSALTGNGQSQADTSTGSDGETVNSDDPEKSFGTTAEEETMRFFYHPDHLGSSSRITDATGKVVQSLEYLPYGEVLLDLRHGDWNTPYLFNAKELDEETGLYYYGARYYNPRLGMFHNVDAFAERYPRFSPYNYAANSPSKYIEVNGDSVAVLNLGGTMGHSALLIQNKEGKWRYFSMNGIPIYVFTNGILGGKSYHDLGEKSFESPQEFLASSYNREVTDPTEVSKNSVNNYGYKEAFILPTTSSQDSKIEAAFRKNARLPYNLWGNQCAQVVQKSLNAAGIKTTQQTFLLYDNMSGVGQTVEDAPYFPFSTFQAIRKNNPNGILLIRK